MAVLIDATVLIDFDVIGTDDMWLAAACLAHRLTLVTANLREFECVPGLAVERWSG